LPNSISLPNPIPAVPENTILVATTRGNVFSFQWPFQLHVFSQSGAAFSSGLLKVAYQIIPGHSSGYDSSNEPGLGGTGTAAQGYCHKELLQAYPAPSNYAEKLTVGSNTLYFVNPWVTSAILRSTVNVGGSASTQMYIYAVVMNTFNNPYTVNTGTIDLTWYSSDHLDGVLYGLYYQGKFYATGSSMPSILPGTSFYAIYKMNSMQLQFAPPYSGGQENGKIDSMMFWGGASVSTTSQDETYFSGTILASGLWIRASCT
jgi:hypothetical protein